MNEKELSPVEKTVIQAVISAIRNNPTDSSQVKLAKAIVKIFEDTTKEERQPKASIMQLTLNVFGDYLKHKKPKEFKRFVKELGNHLDGSTYVMIPNLTHKKISILPINWNKLWKLQLTVMDIELHELAEKKMREAEKEAEELHKQEIPVIDIPTNIIEKGNKDE